MQLPRVLRALPFAVGAAALATLIPLAQGAPVDNIAQAPRNCTHTELATKCTSPGHASIVTSPDTSAGGTPYGQYPWLLG